MSIADGTIYPNYFQWLHQIWRSQSLMSRILLLVSRSRRRFDWKCFHLQSLRGVDESTRFFFRNVGIFKPFYTTHRHRGPDSFSVIIIMNRGNSKISVLKGESLFREEVYCATFSADVYFQLAWVGQLRKWNLSRLRSFNWRNTAMVIVRPQNS
jgi:hypothetical protein